MKILAVDTSARVASAAIADENGIIAEFNMHTTLTHSQTLMPIINSLLTATSLTVNDIDGFACAVGPGSFTGLRIGIGAIKGLAYGQNKPCVPVSTLDGLAENMRGIDAIVCPVMDARCSQVYNSLFELDGENVVKICDDRAISIDELQKNLKEYKKTVFLVGDGANLCYNKINEQKTEDNANIFLANDLLRYQKASSIALIAVKRLLKGEGINANELTPFYLRLPQAERELLLKKSENERQSEE